MEEKRKIIPHKSPHSLYKVFESSGTSGISAVSQVSEKESAMETILPLGSTKAVCPVAVERSVCPRSLASGLQKICA